MTIERRLARAGFTLTRDYPVPLQRVWGAFAEEDQKRDWWGAGDAIEPGEWAFDFRVGGRDVAEGKFHDGPLSRYEATYTDIVEHVRIVTTYDMWIVSLVPSPESTGSAPEFGELLGKGLALVVASSRGRQTR